MTYTKENAIDKACETIVTSWTYDRLTQKEAMLWNDFIISASLKAEIQGTAKQRYRQIMNLYRAFLYGCGYDGPYWREANDDTPRF